MSALLSPESSLAPQTAFPAAGGDADIGVLLCHGFTGSTASMQPWAEHLQAAGFATATPLLPGHGTTWQDLNEATWPQWYASVDDAFGELAARCRTVFVGGLSMGGALALRLAERRGSEVAGIILVNPAVRSNDRRLLALPLLRRLRATMPGVGNDIARPGQDERAYDVVPLRALSSVLRLFRVVRADLALVDQPLLLFRSRTDHVLDPSSARVIMNTVSSADVTERLLHRSWHVATLDYDAETMFAESVEFIRRHAG